jgi:hypothetical protein
MKAWHEGCGLTLKPKLYLYEVLLSHVSFLFALHCQGTTVHFTCLFCLLYIVKALQCISHVVSVCFTVSRHYSAFHMSFLFALHCQGTTVHFTCLLFALHCQGTTVHFTCLSCLLYIVKALQCMSRVFPVCFTLSRHYSAFHVSFLFALHCQGTTVHLHFFIPAHLWLCLTKTDTQAAEALGESGLCGSRTCISHRSNMWPPHAGRRRKCRGSSVTCMHCLPIHGAPATMEEKEVSR